MKTVTFSKTHFEDLYMNAPYVPAGYVLAPPDIQTIAFEYIKSTLLYKAQHTKNFRRIIRQIIHQAANDLNDNHIIVINYHLIEVEIKCSSYGDLKMNSTFLEEIEKGISKNVYYHENIYLLNDL